MLLRLLKLAFGKTARPASAPARSGRADAPAPAEPPAPRITTSELGLQKEGELRALLDHCAAQVDDALPGDVRAAIEASAQRFPAGTPGRDPNVFVYHVEMGQAVLEYRDMKIDTSRFDYAAVLRAFVDSVLRWHPGAHIYLVTNPGSTLAALAGPAVTVVTLEANVEHTMNERVRAMCAYVHSAAFTRDTLFLDSDAFLNAPAHAWLAGEFDLAVTFRNRLGFMPVNEGVMAARAARPEAVRRFFRRYLATYERLAADPRVVAFYGDIRKWRGGQLSLNAAVRGGYPFSVCREIELEGVVLKALPGDTFNYSYEYGNRIDPRELATRAVVHMKGTRKESLDAWLAYAAALPRTLPSDEPCAA